MHLHDAKSKYNFFRARDFYRTLPKTADSI